ncbi:ribosomal protein subunit L36 [Schizosaccharomyces japonicus yFS275]|uniref:Ribosomal protein n=1 Tax=Schizosaccharomyces japonicus (strain yFS275 / FY16936) TaxID=402676 RepID=B6K358_SCHJY|nr:ribosomal protein subunit L36 [Schizosaccharomyces japonicus yFS275]EEB07915.1 ribosomal protein subunit L36 [Schizosaccharomyces japonicus yFS275]
MNSNLLLSRHSLLYSSQLFVFFNSGFAGFRSSYNPLIARNLFTMTIKKWPVVGKAHRLAVRAIHIPFHVIHMPGRAAHAVITPAQHKEYQQPNMPADYTEQTQQLQPGQVQDQAQVQTQTQTRPEQQLRVQPEGQPEVHLDSRPELKQELKSEGQLDGQLDGQLEGQAYAQSQVQSQSQLEQQQREYHVQPAVKRRCAHCYVVRRDGVLYIQCTKNPSHKARQG